jgi:hypothetical protein
MALRSPAPLAALTTAVALLPAALATAAPQTGVHEERRGNAVVSATVDGFGGLVRVADLLVACGDRGGLSRPATGPIEVRVGGQPVRVGGQPGAVAGDVVEVSVPTSCFGSPPAPGAPRTTLVALEYTGRPSRLAMPERGRFLFQVGITEISRPGLRSVVASIDGRRRTAAVLVTRTCQTPPGGVLVRTLTMRLTAGIQVHGLVLGTGLSSLTGSSAPAGTGSVRLRPVVRRGKVVAFSAVVRTRGCAGDPITGVTQAVRLASLTG